MSIVSELLIDKMQCVRTGGKVSASIDVGSGEPYGRVLAPMLFKLYTSQLFHTAGNHIVGYEDDTTIYAVISRPLSRPRVMASLTQDLSPINYWC